METLEQCGIDGIQVFKSGAKTAAGARFLEQVASGEIFSENESAQALAQERLGIDGEPIETEEERRDRQISSRVSIKPVTKGQVDISITEIDSALVSAVDRARVDELASFIREDGENLIPVIARTAPPGKYDDPFMQYEIIAGEEQFIAARQAGVNRVNVWLQDVSDDDIPALRARYRQTIGQ